VTGAEVDFVIEHRRRVLPTEVARVMRVADARALDDFAAEQGSRAPVAVLLCTGSDSVQLTAWTIAARSGAAL
jgi:hypothetical protein